MSIEFGKLYVVATPIGNLNDISFRAIEILKQVDLIAAEDTRHIQALLNHYAIHNHCIALHQHNEQKITPDLISKLQTGQSIALVSDAGTPLINDPGLPLVRAVWEQGLKVVPVPGPCALVTALSASGLSLNQFVFEGFLPRTRGARKSFIEQRTNLPMTWVCYESCHRIADTVADLAETLPEHRQIVIARELTKLYETIVKGTAGEMLACIEQDDNMKKGEFVLIVDAEKTEPKSQTVSSEQLRVLTLLMQQCSLKTAVNLTVEITGGRKKDIYQAALQLPK